jgi:serine protease inhibitor
MGMSLAVRRANALTARWAAECDGSSTAFSGAGVWPLLAALAEGSQGPGRAELAGAVGLDAETGLTAATELISTVRACSAAWMAIGLWVRDHVPLNPKWRDGLPPGTVGEFHPDDARTQAGLDAWVAEHTHRILDRFPLTVSQDTLLVLASALAVRTKWVEPFSDEPLRIENGPWAGRTINALFRRGTGLDDVRLADTPAGPITMLTVAGRDDVDVCLVIGEPDRTAGQVLAASIDALTASAGAPANPVGAPADPSSIWPGSALLVGQRGPCLRVTQDESLDKADRLIVRTPRFDVNGGHDLLEHADIFGLDTVRRLGVAGVPADVGHFPGIGPSLAVGRARQGARATFTAEGFEAAAVTSVDLLAYGLPSNPVRTIWVTIDRPFGFLALHRPTGLVLVAGWVAEPEDWAGQPGDRWT